MPGRQRRTERDQRRRNLGQNFLVDEQLVSRLLTTLDLRPGELVVDIGAGVGALSIPLAMAGVRVWAAEPDSRWAAKLRTSAESAGLAERLRVIETEVQRLRFPREPYRVVANPPFAMTTEILSLLLENPERWPVRADLVLQQEVARKHASVPPASLRTAAWTPWWHFELGMRIQRNAFRPRPSVDARVLCINRRIEPVLPEWLAPRMRDLLRPAWNPPSAANR